MAVCHHNLHLSIVPQDEELQTGSSTFPNEKQRCIDSGRKGKKLKHVKLRECVKEIKRLICSRNTGNAGSGHMSTVQAMRLAAAVIKTHYRNSVSMANVSDASFVHLVTESSTIDASSTAGVSDLDEERNNSGKLVIRLNPEAVIEFASTFFASMLCRAPSSLVESKLWDVLDASDHSTIQHTLIMANNFPCFVRFLRSQEGSDSETGTSTVACKVQCSASSFSSTAGSEQRRQRVNANVTPIPSAYANRKSVSGTRSFGRFTTRHSQRCVIVHVDVMAIGHLGYMPHELYGKSFLSLVHPDDYGVITQGHIELCRFSGKSVKCPQSYRLRAQNGDFISVETEWSCFLNPFLKKIEFVIAQHTVKSAPDNDDVFCKPLECAVALTNSGDAKPPWSCTEEAIVRLLSVDCSNSALFTTGRRKLSSAACGHHSAVKMASKKLLKQKDSRTTKKKHRTRTLNQKYSDNGVFRENKMRRGLFVSNNPLHLKQQRRREGATFMDHLVEEIVAQGSAAASQSRKTRGVAELWNLKVQHDAINAENPLRADRSPQSGGELSFGPSGGSDSGGSGPSYSQINFTENIQRFFDSQAKTHSTDETLLGKSDSNSSSPIDEVKRSDVLSPRQITTSSANQFSLLKSEGFRRPSDRLMPTVPGKPPAALVVDNSAAGMVARPLQTSGALAKTSNKLSVMADDTLLLTSEYLHKHTAEQERVCIQTWRRRKSHEIRHSPIRDFTFDSSSFNNLAVEHLERSQGCQPLKNSLPLHSNGSSSINQASFQRPASTPVMTNNGLAQYGAGVGDFALRSLRHDHQLIRQFWDSSRPLRTSSGLNNISGPTLGNATNAFSPVSPSSAQPDPACDDSITASCSTLGGVESFSSVGKLHYSTNSRDHIG